MKQLILLLLIVLVTAMSWSSYAKNKVTNVSTIYSLSNPIAPIAASSLLSPTLTPLETDDSLSLSQAKAVSKHNRFFELSIVFNENLQQVISLFTRSDDEKSDIANNSIPSYTNNESTVKSCKTTS